MTVSEVSVDVEEAMGVHSLVSTMRKYSEWVMVLIHWVIRSVCWGRGEGIDARTWRIDVIVSVVGSWVAW